MSWRFHRSVKLLPGVRLNLSKTGLGFTFGIPGLSTSIHSSGRRTTNIGLPGTGLAWRSVDYSGAERDPALVVNAVDMWTDLADTDRVIKGSLPFPPPEKPGLLAAPDERALYEAVLAVDLRRAIDVAGQLNGIDTAVCGGAFAIAGLDPDAFPDLSDFDEIIFEMSDALIDGPTVLEKTRFYERYLRPYLFEQQLDVTLLDDEGNEWRPLPLSTVRLPLSKPLVAIRAAVILDRYGRTDDGLSLLMKVDQLDEILVVGAYLLAAHARWRELIELTDDLDPADVVDPEIGVALCAHSLALEALGRIDDALTVLALVIEESVDVVADHARLQRGYALLRLDDRNSASRDLEALARAHPVIAARMSELSDGTQPPPRLDGPLPSA